MPKIRITSDGEYYYLEELSLFFFWCDITEDDPFYGKSPIKYKTIEEAQKAKDLLLENLQKKRRFIVEE